MAEFKKAAMVFKRFLVDSLAARVNWPNEILFCCIKLLGSVILFQVVDMISPIEFFGWQGNSDEREMYLRCTSWYGGMQHFEHQKPVFDLDLITNSSPLEA